MLKLDNNLLQELGLGALPEDQKRGMLQHIYETLELRVGTNLANQMTDQQLEEFEKFIDDGGDANQAQALQWLETNLPNYKEVVNQVFEQLKVEIKQMAPQLLAANAQQGGAPAPQAPATMPPANDPYVAPVSTPDPYVAPQPTAPPSPALSSQPPQTPAGYAQPAPSYQPAAQPAPSYADPYAQPQSQQPVSYGSVPQTVGPAQEYFQNPQSMPSQPQSLQSMQQPQQSVPQDPYFPTQQPPAGPGPQATPPYSGQ